IPAMVDHLRDNFSVFESAAIMLYLGKHYGPEGKLLPKDPICVGRLSNGYAYQNVFCITGLGPMLGQAYHTPEEISYNIRRYYKKTQTVWCA
ncbi:11290_t:CDS:2, partial [Paraglomus occultum]